MTLEQLIQNMYDVNIDQKEEYKSREEFVNIDENGNNLANPNDITPYRVTIFKGNSTESEASGNEFGEGYGLSQQDAIDAAIANKITK